MIGLAPNVCLAYLCGTRTVHPNSYYKASLNVPQASTTINIRNRELTMSEDYGFASFTDDDEEETPYPYRSDGNVHTGSNRCQGSLQVNTKYRYSS
jgi:hypothetical protein